MIKCSRVPPRISPGASDYRKCPFLVLHIFGLGVTQDLRAAQADRRKISPTANENAFWLKDREIIFEVPNRNYGQFPIWEAFRCGAALTERIAWVFTEEVLRALLLREARPGLYRHDTSSHGAV